jgi:hypothetical protein
MMQRATARPPFGGVAIRPLSRPATVAAAAKRASKQSQSADAANAAALPPGVRVRVEPSEGGGDDKLTDRERALLDAAVRDSQQKQPTSKARPLAGAKKGFGSSSPAAAAAAASSAPAVAAPAPSPPPRARPIDPREAARGRVELVNVRSWGGGGAAAEAGDLEIVSVRTLVGDAKKNDTKPPQTGLADGGARADDAPLPPPPPPPPLHVALAQQLQLAEARGALSIASSTGAKPLPPFERWPFTPRSYAQYLADHAAAHAALDDAVDAVIAATAAGAAAAAAGAASTRPSLRAAHSLRWFARERGIARGDAYASDLRAMTGSLEGEEEGAAAGQEPPQPSNGAAALARLLRRLGRDAAAAAAAGEKEGDADDGGEAALKLAAHAYALRAAHLSGSGRITAAAEGRLGLARRGALAAVARYNVAGGKSPPPAAFSADVDAYGREMMAANEQPVEDAAEPYAWARALFAELPSAFRKASSLLDGLAEAAAE